MNIKPYLLITAIFYHVCSTNSQQQNSSNTQSYSIDQPQLQNEDMKLKAQNQQKQQIRIYGVRWSLGDRFSYKNMFKTQPAYMFQQQYAESHNYYTLSFNSDSRIQQQVYLQISNTLVSCSSRRISVPISNDHVQIQFKQNSTMSSTDAYIYRCNVNMDLRHIGSKIDARSYQQPQIPQDQYFQQFPYSIYSLGLQFMYRQDDPNITSEHQNHKIQKKKNILFTSAFRPPLPLLTKQLQINSQSGQQVKGNKLEQNILVAGDWGVISQQVQKTKGYIPILQSALARVQMDKNIVLGIILGDLSYDLFTQKYSQFLSYIQPISSKICLLITPGNHDAFYHKDSFQIFVETFLSPEWDKYYGFYYTFILGDFLFVSYVPENTVSQQHESNIKPIQFMQKDFYNNYLVKLKQNVDPSKKQVNTMLNVDPIKNQYHVIVFSHYPIICSKLNDDLKSCQKNFYRLKQYLNVFTGIGMDLYFSGHLHYYERTHAVCFDEELKQLELMKVEKFIKKTKFEENGVAIQVQIYDRECPNFIVQGTAGNNYFQQSQGSIQPLQFTSKVAFNTGFGLLSLKSQVKKSLSINKSIIQSEIQFSHYKMLSINNSKIQDKFVKKLQILQEYLIEQQKKQTVPQILDINIDDPVGPRILQMLIVFILFIVGSTVCFCYGRSYVERLSNMQPKKKCVQHQDMIQQNYEQSLKSGVSVTKPQNSQN